MKEMPFTPPGEMLAEIRAVNAWIRDLVATPQMVRWHWPTFYLLYVEVDRLDWLIKRIADSLETEPISLDGSEESLDARERGAWVTEACAALRAPQTAVIHRLWQVSRNTMCEVRDAALRRRLQAHLQPKSDWYQTFRSDYCPGRATPDGKVLERTVLVTHPDPAGRIHDLGELCRHQRFDIGTPASRAALAQAAREVGTEQVGVWTAMKDLLVAHCRIEDLIHPSSA